MGLATRRRSQEPRCALDERRGKGCRKALSAERLSSARTAGPRPPSGFSIHHQCRQPSVAGWAWQRIVRSQTKWRNRRIRLVQRGYRCGPRADTARRGMAHPARHRLAWIFALLALSRRKRSAHARFGSRSVNKSEAPFPEMSRLSRPQVGCQQSLQRRNKSLRHVSKHWQAPQELMALTWAPAGKQMRVRTNDSFGRPRMSPFRQSRG